MQEEQIDYFVSVPCKDDIEVLKRLVYLYSVSLVVRGKATVILRKQIIDLTALYIRDGYNRETKNMAAKVLRIKVNMVDQMNRELTISKILVEDEDGYSGKDLNPELKQLQSTYKNSIGIRPPWFLFKLDEE